MDYIDIFENFAIKSAVAKMESLQQTEAIQEVPVCASPFRLVCQFKRFQ